MINKIKVLLLIVVLVGGAYFFGNNYISDIELKVKTVEADTFSKKAQVQMIREKIKENEFKDLEIHEPTSDELVHILPKGFDFYDVVVKLDQLEMNVGIESIKNITKTETKPELFANLQENIIINNVSINFEVDMLEYHKIGAFIKEIQNLEQLIIIESISYTLPGDPYIVEMNLLYFTYTTLKDLD